MRQGIDAYDLGDVGAVAPQRRADLRQRVVRRTAVEHHGWVAHPAVVRSFALFVPGAGHVLRGRTMSGLFFFLSMAFLATLIWSVLATIERMVATFELLGISIAAIFWGLTLIYASIAGLHLAGVVSSDDSPPEAAHPVAAGMASALAPGWGQLLNGDRIRAALFVGCLWLVAGVALWTSSSATETINAHVPIVTPWEQFARSPLILWTLKWTLPAVVWCLAVYDAAATATYRRREVH